MILLHMYIYIEYTKLLSLTDLASKDIYIYIYIYIYMNHSEEEGESVIANLKFISHNRWQAKHFYPIKWELITWTLPTVSMSHV